MKRYKRHFPIIVTAVLLLTCFCSITAIAAPTEEKGWVDIAAEVPQGFNGSVTVLLFRAEDEEYYYVSTYFLNDYKNSIQLPVGTYTVEHVYTSEDPLSYDAFIETDSFELMTVQKLSVQVKHNTAGGSFVATDPDADLIGNTSSDMLETNTPEQEAPADSNASSQPNKDNISDSKDSELPSDSVSEEHSKPLEPPSDEENEKNPWLDLLKQLGIVILGSCLFALLLFSGVYLVRRFAMDD